MIKTIADGYYPLQHHDTEFEPHLRIVNYGFRTPKAGLFEPINVDSLTEGPIHGWHLLETQDNEVHPRLWVQAAPVLSDGTGWAPARDTWDSPDDRLKPVAASSPLGLKFPDGYPGVVVAGSELDSQAQLTAPAWAGLVAPSFSGPLEVASAVWDVVGGGLSENYAPVTSAWRIYSRPAGAIFGSAPREYLGLSWELGYGGTDAAESVSGLGMVGEHGMGRSLLAAAGHKAGGPLEVGSPNDIHRIGRDPATGEPINALHLSTYSLFERPDGSGDASQEDGGRYRPVRSAPLTTPAWWRHDAESFHNWSLGVGPGQWRWQASSFIAAIPDDPDKGKPGGGGPPIPLPPAGGGPKTSDPLDPGQIPPDNFGFPKPGPLPPEIYITEILPRDPKGNRPLAGTAGEIAVRGLVFRESLDWKNFQDNKWAIDSRNQLSELSREAEQDWIDAPSLIRVDVASDPSSRSKSTNNRYASVGAGIAWLLPAELGLEEIVDANRNGSNPLIDYTTIGKRWLGFGRGVNLHFGNASTNGPWERGQGISFEFVPAGTFWKMTSVSSSGTATDIATMLSSGAFSTLSSVTSPAIYGTNLVDTDELFLSSEAKSLSLIQDTGGSWGSNRQQVFKDRDGTVALDALETEVYTANFNATMDKVHGVKASGGAYTGTLPAISASNVGKLLVIADIDGGAISNNITVNAAGSDLIIGGSSTTIEDAYGCLKLRPILDGSQGIWIREC